AQADVAQLVEARRSDRVGAGSIPAVSTTWTKRNLAARRRRKPEVESSSLSVQTNARGSIARHSSARIQLRGGGTAHFDAERGRAHVRVGFGVFLAVTAPGGGMVPASPLLQVAGFVTIAGAASFGGSRKRGWWCRSRLSRRSSALASRYVSAGRFHFVSTNFRIDVWSCVTCDT